MKETVMLNIFNKLEWLITRNRLYEVKRLLKREIENLKSITEKKCKRVKINKEYCRICKNFNCNNHYKVAQRNVN